MNDFCQALIEKNTTKLLNAPKSDIHNHSVKGCNKAWLEERLNHKFPDTPDRFDGLEGMQKWFTCSIKPYCTGAEGIIIRWEGAFAEAKRNNIVRLVMNFGPDEIELVGGMKSFERIINVPRRGIGDTAALKIKKAALEHNLSMYEYICEDYALEECPPKAINTLRSLIMRINHTRDEINKDEETFSKILEDLINDIGYYDYLLLDEDGDDRLENVKSLFEDLRHFLKSNPDATFDEYLQNVALVSAQDDMVEGEHVTLMTVHTAKGLEYPVVFVVKLNQGIFPSNRALTEGGYAAIEEERRLAYVAFTRAKERLYLTYSHGFSYVVKSELSESMFIAESGNSTASRPTTRNSFRDNRPSYHYSYEDKKKDAVVFDDLPFAEEPFSQEVNNGVDDWKVGDICIHQKFGKGVVTALEGDGIIVVNFEGHGEKTLLGNHKMISKGSK